MGVVMTNPVRVRIKNFQSIEDVDIEINGFTCITGKTNIGKSAIMRAISKAILNDPVIGLVRKGTPHSTVDIESKEWGLVWEKGEKGINRYKIGDRILDKTGQTQIEETKEFGFSSIRLGGDDIQPWFAPQMEPIFLLNKSGPQITDFVSEVSGLNVLQDAIVLSSRGRKKAIEEAKNKASEAVQIKEKIDNLSGVDDLLRLFKDLEAQRDSIIEYQSRLLVLENSNRSMNNLSLQLGYLNKIELVSSNAILIEELQININVFKIWKKMRACADQIISFRRVRDISIPEISKDVIESAKILSHMSRISVLKKQIHEIQKANDASLPEVSNEKVQILDRLQKCRNSVVNLSAQIKIIEESRLPGEVEINGLTTLVELNRSYTSLKFSEYEVFTKLKELSNIEKEISEIEKEILEIPKCPTCGRVSTSQHPESFIRLLRPEGEDQISVDEFSLG
jgi:hypothetical protein